MCTLSWTIARDGYELFFNRDELNSRAAEVGPELSRDDGVDTIAPRDGDRQGTWLLANEFGLTICLLNDYGHPWQPSADGARYSRGHVVLACAAAANHEGVVAAVREQPLSRVRPFQLMALSPDEGPLLLRWQGLQLVQRRAETLVPPITSSSFATDVVVAMRTWRFSSLVRSALAPDAAELAAYHRQHSGSAGAQSVLMCRPDASTRSISHVRVTGSHVQMTYRPVRWAARGPVVSQPVRIALARRHPVTMAA
jgi:hypothetical protein